MKKIINGSLRSILIVCATLILTACIDYTRTNDCENVFSLISTPKSIEAGPNATICFGSSTQLQGSGATYYQWTPATGLSDPAIANPIASPALTTTYTLTGWYPTNELIINGNFNSANTGFSTDYTYSSNLYPEGYYNVGTNPHSFHPNWSTCGDHTSGHGRMMIVNGAPVPNQKVWYETVNVVQNTNYIFSTWIQSVFAGNPAQLQFSINGNMIGPVFTATFSTCVWNQFYATWNSGSATTATICIVNQNTVRDGNDFALDDISFSAVTSASDIVTIYVSHISPDITVTDVSCYGNSNGAAIANPNGGFSPYTYLWSTGATTQGITGLAAGSYALTVTDFVGCKYLSGIIITQPQQLVATIINSGNATLPGNNNGWAQVMAAGGTSPYSYSWSSGSTDSIAHSLSAGTYTVTVVDNNGCSDSASVTIKGQMPLPIGLLFFNAVCEDQQVNLNWSTAAEINNAHFTIERSTNAIDWEFVANVPGAGNSNAVILYNSFDPDPWQGTSYYRLSCTDYNGFTEVIKMQDVECSCKQLEFNVFQNPTKGDFTVTAPEGTTELRIYTPTRQLVMKKNLNGLTSIDLNLSTSGMYIIDVTSVKELKPLKLEVIK
jgi:hypothetical protein